MAGSETSRNDPQAGSKPGADPGATAGGVSESEQRRQRQENAKQEYLKAHDEYFKALNACNREVLAELNLQLRKVRAQHESGEVFEERYDADLLLEIYERHSWTVDRYVKALIELVRECPDVDDGVIERAILTPLVWADDATRAGSDPGSYFDLAQEAAYAACEALVKRWYRTRDPEHMAKATTMLKLSDHILAGYVGFTELNIDFADELIAWEEALRKRAEQEQQAQDWLPAQTATHLERGIDRATRRCISRPAMDNDPYGIRNFVRAGSSAATAPDYARSDPRTRICLRVIFPTHLM